MTEAILKWFDSDGWLVFSGGVTSGSPIRAQALTRAIAEGGVAYISLAEDTGDSLLDDMEDLGAPTGYMVDLIHDEPETIVEQIKEASVVVIEIGESVDALFRVFRAPAQEGIQRALERGAVVLIEGLAINLFGKWTLSDSGDILQGLDWVQNSFLEPASEGIESSRAVQAVMQNMPDTLAISISEGSALALGPNSQVETWGEKQVTLSLTEAKHTPQND